MVLLCFKQTRQPTENHKHPNLETYFHCTPGGDYNTTLSIQDVPAIPLYWIQTIEPLRNSVLLVFLFFLLPVKKTSCRMVFFSSDKLAGSWLTAYYSCKIFKLKRKKYKTHSWDKKKFLRPSTYGEPSALSFSCHKSYFTRVCMASRRTPGCQLSEKVMASRLCHGTEATPACAKGRVLQWKCCQLLSSQLEIAGVLLYCCFPHCICLSGLSLSKNSPSVNTVLSYCIITLQSRAL